MTTVLHTTRRSSGQGSTADAAAVLLVCWLVLLAVAAAVGGYIAVRWGLQADGLLAPTMRQDLVAGLAGLAAMTPFLVAAMVVQLLRS